MFEEGSILGIRVVSLIPAGEENLLEETLKFLERRRGIRQQSEAHIFILNGAKLEKEEIMKKSSLRFQIGIRPKISVFDLSRLSYSAIFLRGVEAFKGKVAKILGEFLGDEGEVLYASLCYSLANDSVKILSGKYKGIRYEKSKEEFGKSLPGEIREEILEVLDSVRDLYVAISSLDAKKVGLMKEELRRRIAKARKKVEGEGMEIAEGIFLGIERDLWEILSGVPSPEFSFSLAEWCCRTGHIYYALMYMREAISKSLKGILGEFFTSQELKEMAEEIEREDLSSEAEDLLKEIKGEIRSKHDASSSK